VKCFAIVTLSCTSSGFHIFTHLPGKMKTLDRFVLLLHIGYFSYSFILRLGTFRANPHLSMLTSQRRHDFSRSVDITMIYSAVQCSELVACLSFV
jgi:hypothetical protein